MPTLTIIMRGISLTYQKDGLLKTIFPFADEKDCHRVVFYGGASGPVELAAPRGSISVRTDNAAAATLEGDEFEDFVDLTDPEYAHGALRLKDGWQEHSVLLTMESAVLSHHEPTLSRYQLRQKDGDVTKPPRHIAYSGRVDIEAERIVIEASGERGFSMPIERDSIVLIDNECDQKPSDVNGDLELLYGYIVEDADDPKRQFVVERDPRDEPKNKIADLIELRPENNVRPFQRGLPCNKFVASNVVE